MSWESTAMLWYAQALHAPSGLEVAMTRTMKTPLAPSVSRQGPCVVLNVT